MTDFSTTWVTARKNHICSLCSDRINPKEIYQRQAAFDAGDVWVTKTCEWCVSALTLYYHYNAPDDYMEDWVFDWFQEHFPTIWTNMQAGWRYPDGERTNLPWQSRCFSCGTWTKGSSRWCAPCNQKRIEKLDAQFLAIYSQFSTM